MVQHNNGSTRIPRLDIRERLWTETRVSCLGDGHEFLAEPSLNVHFCTPQLPGALEQFNEIIQVNYRAKCWILPWRLVDLVRIDHVPVRIVGQQYSRRISFQYLGELA